jgi:hypothetical protein
MQSDLLSVSRVVVAMYSIQCSTVLSNMELYVPVGVAVLPSLANAWLMAELQHNIYKSVQQRVHMLRTSKHINCTGLQNWMEQALLATTVLPTSKHELALFFFEMN